MTNEYDMTDKEKIAIRDLIEVMHFKIDEVLEVPEGSDVGLKEAIDIAAMDLSVHLNKMSAALDADDMEVLAGLNKEFGEKLQEWLRLALNLKKTRKNN
jgi:hypothetical protein